ncbi:MAG: hypothetical protein KatS3mg065_0349 [Chloroflexota bacterium]|nr:MAG: hypothetical protein KatS3mg065_0349 [Chloroflexota bacterium]
MPDNLEIEFRGAVGPNRDRSLRIGIVAGVALTLVLGTVAVMGALPGAAPADPLDTAALGTGTAGTVIDDSLLAAPIPAAGWVRDGGSGGPAGPFGFGLGRGLGHFAARSITITAINGSNISLRTDDGWTRTITVTSETTITKAGQTISVSDLRVGDEIRFAQQRNSDGTYTITRIVVVVPTVAGVVTNVTDTTITITARNGTSETIRTTASTTYKVGDAAGSRSDVVVGAIIVAAGERGSDGTLTAATVVVALPRVGGTVSAKTSDSITIERPNGTTVVAHVSGSTTYTVKGVDNATLADVQTGMAIVVVGRQRSDGSIDAVEVWAGNLGRWLGPGFGGRHGRGFGFGFGPWSGPQASPSPSPGSGSSSSFSS